MIDKIAALGGIPLLDQLVTIFLEQIDTRRTAIEALSRGEAAAEGIRAAHSLKSTAAQLGLVRLSRLAGTIEKTGRDGRPAAVAVLFTEFDVAIVEAKAVITADLDRRKEPNHA
jgi:HPt (histidine-containing phosphotransfer) domain-containing protein